YSQKFFTLNNLYAANSQLFNSILDINEYAEYATKFWEKLCGSITEWQEVDNKNITKIALRTEYIITQGIVLEAFGKLGNYFIKNPELNIDDYLWKLSKINWQRQNPIWIERALKNGRISKSSSSVQL